VPGHLRCPGQAYIPPKPRITSMHSAKCTLLRSAAHQKDKTLSTACL
jgi:hypothetical protein